MKSFLATILFFIATGVAYPQGNITYDIGHATLEWKNEWIVKTEEAPKGAWVDKNKTFPTNVIYCNIGEANPIAHTVTAPIEIVPFLDFIKVEGTYTCRIDVVTNAGTELKMTDSVTFKAEWPPRVNTDLVITILP